MEHLPPSTDMILLLTLNIGFQDKLILQKLSAMSMFDAVACKDSSAAAAKSLAMSLEDDLIPTIGNNGLLLTDSLDNRQTLALAGRIVQQLKTAEKWPQNELEMPGVQENRLVASATLNSEDIFLGLSVHTYCLVCFYL